LRTRVNDTEIGRKLGIELRSAQVARAPLLLGSVIGSLPG
jgi:hypothetical protein